MALPKRSASKSTTATRLVAAQTRNFRAASLCSPSPVLTPTMRRSPAPWNGSLVSGPANQMLGLTLGICSLSLTGSPTTTCNGFTEILWPVRRLGISAQPNVANFQSGVTIGAVVVPQSMAYAILAELPPQYGLYSSFMGVLLYWFFATSKDITIGVSLD
jgi:hypothetical protein